MNEATTSVFEIIKNRLTNPLYGTFFLTWVIFHWNFIFSILVLDDRKVLVLTGLLKNDYLLYRYFDIYDWYFWFSLLVPFVLTYFIIWKFPKWILIPAYRKSKEHETEKRIIKNTEELKVITAIRLLEEENVKTAKIITERAQERKRAQQADPTIGWEEDFLKFKESANYDAFRQAVGNFYSGHREVNNNSLTSYLDSMGIAKLSENNPNYIMSFTDKGSYFIRKMNEFQ